MRDQLLLKADGFVFVFIFIVCFFLNDESCHTISNILENIRAFMITQTENDKKHI